MRKLVIMMTICLAMVMSVSVTKADTMTLDVTYQDFLDDSHPDFGFPDGPYGLDLGIVAATLGADGTPDYAGGTGTNTTHGETYFYDWYHDTDASTTVAGQLEFTKNDITGLYEYSSDSFFPLDYLGNTAGEDHNFYFTMELHTTFTYEVGQTFFFEGDDDVFVYINGELVIDLGGIHEAEGASVDFTPLSLVAGQNYTFDLFFAERNPIASDFVATTNIAFDNPVVPVPGAILLGLLGMGATGLKLRRFA